MLVPSAESLIWALMGLAAGLFLAMAGFALMAFVERRALRRRLRASRQAAVALAEPAPARAVDTTAPLFAAPPAVSAKPMPADSNPTPAAAVVAASPAATDALRDLEPAAPAPPPAEIKASLPVAAAAEPEGAPAQAGEGTEPLPKGIQAAVAEAAKRRRVQRARERGEPLPAEPDPTPRPAVPAKAVPAWMRPPEPAAADAPRSDVNVEALFEKAFGASAGISTEEQAGSDAGQP